jgi:hypothetical protein
MAAAGGCPPGAGADEIGQKLTVGGRDDSAGRHEQHAIVTVGPVAVAARTGASVAGPLVRMAVVVEQRRHRRIDNEDDVAAAATVATVRAAERLELLPVRRGAAVPAIAGSDMQDDAIDEGGYGHDGQPPS